MPGRSRPVFLGLIMSFLLAAVFFCTPASAGTGFSDVPEDHWAAKYIVKMDAMGLVAGYSDGTFKPDANVSQLEAVVLAVRCTGRNTPGTAEVPFDVPWGKKDVARALEMGLLQGDESFSPRESASRAWVTRLLVRVAGMDEEARNASVMPNFTDAYKIPGWADGYVKVAQDNNLVGGYRDGTFRPERPVTRKEMAVLLERAMDYVEKPECVVSGVVTGVSGDRATLSAGGNVYEAGSSVPAYGKDGMIDISSLERGDRVSLVVGGGEVKYLEKLPGQPASEVVTGTVKTVYPEKATVVVETPEGQYRSLYLPEGAGISVTGSDRQGLHALQEGDQVEVTLDSLGYISGIVVKSRSLDRGSEGIVYEVAPAENLITIQDAGGKLVSFRLGEQVSVKVEGRRFPSLEDIRPGDKVRLGVKDGIVEEIEVLQLASLLDIDGSVVAVAPEKSVITLETGEGLKAFNVSGDAEITIGGEEASLGDVSAGDEVKARVEAGKVTSLEVKGQREGNKFTATVKAVDTGNDSVTLQDSEGELHLYQVSDSARILVDGEEAGLGDLEKDAKVSARLLEGEIIFLEVDNSITGEVAEIDKEGLLLVLRDGSGGTESYVLDKDVDVDSEDSRNDLDEIERGDYVEITRDGSVVTDINLRSRLVYQVDRVSGELDKIYVEDEDGDEERLRLNSGVELSVPGTDAPGVEDVKEGDTVRATYLGPELQKVEVLRPERGEVTSVNSYAETLTVNYYSGGQETLDFGSDSRVITGGDSYRDLGKLSSGDRVEVQENAAGGYDIRVMDKVSGEVVLTTGDEVYLEGSYSGWEGYPLHDNVYVHGSSGASLSPGDLARGDSVQLFLLNEEVYEIYRQ